MPTSPHDSYAGESGRGLLLKPGGEKLELWAEYYTKKATCSSPGQVTQAIQK